MSLSASANRSRASKGSPSGSSSSSSQPMSTSTLGSSCVRRDSRAVPSGASTRRRSTCCSSHGSSSSREAGARGWQRIASLNHEATIGGDPAHDNGWQLASWPPLMPSIHGGERAHRSPRGLAGRTGRFDAEPWRTVVSARGTFVAGCLAQANGLLRVAKCGFQPMDGCSSGCQLQGNRRKGWIHEPTIIFAIEQGAAERGAVALQGGPVLIGHFP
jgi:hypothetical protein